MNTKMTLSTMLSNFFLTLVASILLGLATLAGLVYAFEYYGYETSISTNVIIMGCSVLTFIVLGCFSILKDYRQTKFWCLDGNLLTRGSPVNLTVDLSNVEKAIAGIPRTKLLEFFHAHKLGFLEHRVIREKYYYTTTLKVSENEYLPLFIYHIDGGPELMESIHLKIKDKIDIDHQFTEQEKKILKIRKVNNLIKSNV